MGSLVSLLGVGVCIVHDYTQRSAFVWHLMEKLHIPESLIRLKWLLNVFESFYLETP